MDIGWNFRREHLPLRQRSHSVILDGGDLPNVVPQTASTWYYLRELDYAGIKAMWAVADSVAEGAALMTGTTLLPRRVLGAAWPRHFNRPMAQAMDANIRAVGMPAWTEDDQRFARAVQRAAGAPDSGLKTTVDTLHPPLDPARNLGGASDDIGDVSWSVPTVVLYYPGNVQRPPGHSWADAMTMATPIAHKGVGRGRQGPGDDAARPAAPSGARGQRAATISPTCRRRPSSTSRCSAPRTSRPLELNREILDRYRPAMRRYYYDPRKHRSYLEQLGVAYPVLPDSAGSCKVTVRER